MKTEYRKIRLASCLAPVFVMLLGGQALSAQTKGSLSIEDYYLNDTSDDGYQHLLTTRLKLDMTKLDKSGAWALHFDGRERLNLGTYDSSSEDARVDVLNFDYTGKSVYVAVGRVWPKELSTERVDGVNAVYQWDKYGLGSFLGLRPDPYSEMFTTEFVSGGAYAYYKTDSLSTNAAFTHTMYKGATDRQYLYSQTTYVKEKITLLGLLTGDINQRTKGLSLTNGLLDLSFKPAPNKGVSVGYNQFKSVQLYASTDEEVDPGSERSYYLAFNYRFRDKYNLFARVERQNRDYASLEDGYKDGMAYKTGVNIDGLLKTGVNLNLGASLSDGFGGEYNSYDIEASRVFKEVLQLVMNGSYSLSRYTDSDTTRIWAYGLSGYLYMSKRWTFTLSYNGEYAEDYTVNSLLTRLAIKF
ncbi:MAG: hypothetical protein A2X93_04975 [Deltaproteobacteria bacterium GWC2_56_8]|nr:MAG: hypothetical protein A2X99_05210 [Deltaproteobacteria bacterium GWB2_55_19]OGP36681.1 MAG: hypothetical protein A2X93_04975 [Deltaproteobacteria bacterium GWC2_56_8]HAO92685.1 hypothetical protein [Deltaproteobacteria bacterium]